MTIQSVDQRLYTLRQCAQVLQVSLDTVRKQIAIGRLRSVFIGGVRRVFAEDLDAYLHGLKEDAD